MMTSGLLQASCRHSALRGLTMTLGVMALLCAAGCGEMSRPVSLGSWRESIEEYVWEEANGDPNALRNVNWADTQKGFSILGKKIPEGSTDANGLLLGHRQIEGRNWFIFLVGLVRDRNVKDVRLAAMSVQEGQFVWRMSEPNPQALTAYRQFKQSVAESARSAVSESAQPIGFPDLADAFELSIDGGRIVALHPLSGAQWMLSIHDRGANE